VVAALGSIRNVEWLEGAGLAAGRWGVGCDAGCRAFDINGVVTDSIFVAGDIARAPHVLYEYQFLSMEHWDNAVLGAAVAAHNMVSLEPDRYRMILPASGQPVWREHQVGGCAAVRRRDCLHPRPVKERRFAAYGTAGGLYRHLQPRQVAGVLRRTDRTVRATTAGRDKPVDISRCRPSSGPEQRHGVEVVLTGHDPASAGPSTDSTTLTLCAQERDNSTED
jgi:3-phenylpropionate/trans-cinnamate dioxygenase ferredoxin reductase subunit